MKKFMKGCAILALVMLVLGAGLAIAAGTARGSAVITKVVDSVTGGRLHVNFGNWNLPWGVYWNSGVHYDLNVSDIYNDGYPILHGDTSGYSLGSDIDSLQIELGGYILETRASKDDSFYLETKNVENFQCYVENGVLCLKAVNSNGISIGITQGKRVTLFIPEEQYFEEVEVELGAGEITLENVNTGEMSLEVGAGGIYCRNIKAGELEASVGAGEIKLDGIDVEVLDVEVGMGEIVGNGSIRKSASLECSMGNLELTLKGSERDFNYRLEVAVGNLTLGRNSYSGLAKEQNIQNGAEKNMDIQCSMGNATILFED